MHILHRALQASNDKSKNVKDAAVATSKADAFVSSCNGSCPGCFPVTF